MKRRLGLVRSALDMGFRDRPKTSAGAGQSERGIALSWVIAIPLSALAVAALSLLLVPERELLFARVVGGPTDAPSWFRGRVFAGRQESSLTLPLSGSALTVVAQQGRFQTRRTLRVGDDGWAEFSIPRVQAEPLRIEVLLPGARAEALVLARGSLHLETARYFESPTRRGERKRPHRLDRWLACLHYPTGVLSVPFRAPAEITLYRSIDRAGASTDEVAREDCRRWKKARPSGMKPAPGVVLRLSGDGAEVTPSVLLTDSSGEQRFQIRPLHHTARLRVEWGEQGAALEEVLPVVAGSYWLEPTPGGEMGSSGAPLSRAAPWVIRSPVPRPDVWFTFLSPDRRGPGGRVSLVEQPDGSALARWQPPQDAEGFTHLLLASDPDGQSASMVGYPLDGSGITLSTSDVQLLNGLPSARRRADAAARRVRAVLGSYVAVAALLTLTSFFFLVRSRQRELDARLLAAGADAPKERASPWPLVLATLCVFFAFSASLVWILLR